jgi:PAS domain S-box-containing protein
VIIAVLSHFDRTFGPRVFLHAPESVKVEKLSPIADLFNLLEGNFNVYIWEKHKSANLLFDLPSYYGRGRVEMLQISVVVDINTPIKMNHMRELLEEFKKDLSDINDCYKAFYTQDSKFEGDRTIYEELKTKFSTFYKSLKPSIKALKEAENRYQSLFEGARDAIIIFEESSKRVIDINTEAENILKGVKKSITESKISELPFIESTERVIHRIRAQAESENAKPIIIKIKNGAKKEIPLEVNANKIQIGDHTWIQLICRDITERLIAKQKLQESERKYKQLVENVNSIILKWNFKGKIIYINSYGERFFGYTKDELEGSHVLGTIVPETETSGRNLKKIIRNILTNPDKYKTNENENITKNGRKVWISWTNSALRDERGNLIGVLSVGNDITYKRK